MSEQRPRDTIVAKPIAIALAFGFIILAVVLVVVHVFFSPIKSDDLSVKLPAVADSKLHVQRIQQQQRAILNGEKTVIGVEGENSGTNTVRLPIKEAMHMVVKLYDPVTENVEGVRQ